MPTLTRRGAMITLGGAALAVPLMHRTALGQNADVSKEMILNDPAAPVAGNPKGDVTIVAFGRMVQFAETAAKQLAEAGVDCEVIDPRTTSPLDSDAILKSVKKTGRLVVVDEALPRCGMASDISAIVSEHGFDTLKAPIKRVTPPHNPVPFAPNLEQAHIPSPEKIIEAVKSVMGGKS